MGRKKHAGNSTEMMGAPQVLMECALAASAANLEHTECRHGAHCLHGGSMLVEAPRKPSPVLLNERVVLRLHGGQAGRLKQTVRTPRSAVEVPDPCVYNAAQVAEEEGKKWLSHL